MPIDSPIVSEKIIYKARFFEVLEQEIHLKATFKKHTIVKRKPVSVVLPIDSDNNVYLISQYRDFFSKRILEAVAGHCDEGENALEAAKRELIEETGISGKEWIEIAKVEKSASVIRSTSTIFMVKNLGFGNPIPEDGEDIKVVKLHIGEAVKKVLAGEINTATSMIGLLLLEKMLREKKI